MRMKSPQDGKENPKIMTDPKTYKVIVYLTEGHTFTTGGLNENDKSGLLLWLKSTKRRVFTIEDDANKIETILFREYIKSVDICEE